MKEEVATAEPQLPAGQAMRGVSGQGAAEQVSQSTPHPTDPSVSAWPDAVVSQRCCVEVHEGFSSQYLRTVGTSSCSLTVPGDAAPEPPAPPVPGAPPVPSSPPVPFAPPVPSPPSDPPGQPAS